MVAGAAAFVLSQRESKQYTATASLVFTDNPLVQQIAGLQPTGSTAQSQQSTWVQLLQLGDLAAQTAKSLDHGLTAEKVHSSVGVSAIGTTDIVNVSATVGSPLLAAEIANTYSRQFVAEQARSTQQYVLSALALVNKHLAALSPRHRYGPAGLALQDRAQSLSILAGERSSTVQMAQAATAPSSPSAPDVTRNTVVGLVVGLLLSVAIAFLLETLDRTIRDPEELAAVYRMRLLGAVPQSKSLSHPPRRGRDQTDRLPLNVLEAFRMLHAYLRHFSAGPKLQTLLVVSAASGDGKTTIARHLAATATAMGERVLLVEVDLRKPRLADEMAIRPEPGLSEVLLGVQSLSEAIQALGPFVASDEDAHRSSLDVLVAGRPVSNPTKLIGSFEMEMVLQVVAAKHDLVVIDTPALTAVSDAFPLLTQVDGVLVVGRIGRHRREEAKRLRDTLTAVDCPVVGVVANGSRASKYAGYGHGYDQPSQSFPVRRQPLERAPESATTSPQI